MAILWEIGVGVGDYTMKQALHRANQVHDAWMTGNVWFRL